MTLSCYAFLHCSTAIQWVCKNSAFPNREAFYRMSSKSSPTDRQSSEPSSPTMMNLWAKRQVCIVYHQRSCHYVFMSNFAKGFYGQACVHKYLIPQSFNWIKPIIYMHQSSTKLSFLRHTLRNSTGICCCFNSRVVQPFTSGCPENEPFWSLRYQFLTFFNTGIFCWKFCNSVCKERQLQTVMSSLVFKNMQFCIVRSLYACLVVKFLKM